MRRVLPLAIVVIVACLGVYAAKRGQVAFAVRPVAGGVSVNRIVSLAPSVTETVFALGAGDKLVGVTRYCLYPREAQKIAKVGGYIDPNFEAIVRLKPELAIITTGNNDSANRLGELGIRVIAVDNNTIKGIVDSIAEIGKTVGEQKHADELATDIRNRMDLVRKRTKDRPKPSVLISVGRSMGVGVDEIYVAGKNNFYDEIIEIGGGRNAFDTRISKTPTLSGEGITRLNPDVIIDLQPEKPTKDIGQIILDWNTLPHVSAVKNRRVYVLNGDYVVIPGPRFINTLEDVAKAIHPEVDWSHK